MIGAEFAPGMESFHCPLIINAGGFDQHCGVSAQGLAAWNYQIRVDELVAENTTGDLSTIKRQLAETESALSDTRERLAKAIAQLRRVHNDAWHQCRGHGVQTTDGRPFSLLEVNRCAEVAGQLNRPASAGWLASNIAKHKRKEADHG
jgi:hypothetical protein